MWSGSHRIIGPRTGTALCCFQRGVTSSMSRSGGRASLEGSMNDVVLRGFLELLGLLTFCLLAVRRPG